MGNSVPSSSSSVVSSGTVNTSRTGAGAMSSPLGIKNFGNTCYMNAGLQFISAMGIFTEENFGGFKPNKNSTEEVCRSLISTLTQLSRPGRSTDVVSPYQLFKQLRQQNPDLFNQQQQDAHEFIMYALEIIHNGTIRACSGPKLSNEELERLSRKSTRPGSVFWSNYMMRNNSILNNTICGQFRSRITCEECGSHSDTYDPFWDITLALPEVEDECEQVSIGSCFRKFFEEQKLFQENDEPNYNCSHCKNVVNATRSIHISQFPSVMFVTLKRFNNSGEKCNGIVSFKTAGIILKSLSEIGHFKLVAVLQHSGGTLFQGHYISYVYRKEFNGWFRFDDDLVTMVDDILEEDIQAYCLLYVMESKSTLVTSPDRTCATGTKTRKAKRN
ncbi:ubiquitin C-terminal hydrolase of the cysteine proteinase fold [Cryptosporidium canis]|uniref:Ubiquitin carboxyl-terminal hydrolase n=1 Tax=Cryptosporidium canis TaxID=195482 RepID=A0ABQ8PAM9_9CRYT|nr:ubiquitin C-terminal hydrolase of the cysteine proteinase fold [Cryptosporidium canis]KAJ1614523.1 ubiquitin C-terminal hydrolase of the cysteine proteinase fold [Cryptosporidium canis]